MQLVMHQSLLLAHKGVRSILGYADCASKMNERETVTLLDGHQTCDIKNEIKL
jgi:hypothetical protein